MESKLKESFKDILQELMETELDAALGYEKNQKGALLTDNKRTDFIVDAVHEYKRIDWV